MQTEPAGPPTGNSSDLIDRMAVNKMNRHIYLSFYSGHRRKCPLSPLRATASQRACDPSCSTRHCASRSASPGMMRFEPYSAGSSLTARL